MKFFNTLFASMMLFFQATHAQTISSATMASASTEIALKNGKKVTLGSAQFPLYTGGCNPTNCDPVDCKLMDCNSEIKVIKKWRNICMAAHCGQIQDADITKILGPDVIHWRINRSAGTMTQFLGDRPLGDAVKASIPPVLANPNEVKVLPIIGLKNANAEVAQYWIWSKK